MTKKQQAERDEAIVKLREWLKPGDTVYTILTHVSRSGMSRRIRTVVFRNGTDLHPNWLIAQATGRPVSDYGIRADGCGMDMGFELVYNLSRVMFSGGFGCIGENCPSNDHSNGDRNHAPNTQVYNDEAIARDHLSGGTANTHWHNDGGYALKQRWL